MNPKEPDQSKKVAVWLTLQSLLLPGRPHVTNEYASRIMQFCGSRFAEVKVTDAKRVPIYSYPDLH